MSFEITAPGYFKQRNGGKSEVLAERDGQWYGRLTNDGDGQWISSRWLPSGAWHYPHPGDQPPAHGFDLISVWQDPPAFSVGDTVLVNMPGGTWHQHYGTVSTIGDSVSVDFHNGFGTGFRHDQLTRVTLPAPLPEGFRLKARNVKPVRRLDISFSRNFGEWRTVVDWFHDAETSDRLYPAAAPYFFAEPILQPEKPEPERPDPGEGWRLLELNESPCLGDESSFMDILARGGRWCAYLDGDYHFGRPLSELRTVQGPGFYVRRRISPLPEPPQEPWVAKFKAGDRVRWTHSEDIADWLRGKEGMVVLSKPGRLIVRHEGSEYIADEDNLESASVEPWVATNTYREEWHHNGVTWIGEWTGTPPKSRKVEQKFTRGTDVDWRPVVSGR